MPKIFSFSSEKSFLVKACDAAITVVPALIFFFLPIFFTSLVAQGIIFEKVILFYLLVLVGVVAWATKGVVEGELKIIRTPLDWPLISLAVIFFVSAIFSVDQLTSFIGSYGSTTKSVTTLLTYVAFYYLVVNNLNQRRLKIFFWSLISGVLITIFYSALQLSGIFILPFVITKAVSFNTIGSISSLGIYAAAALPLLALAIPFAIQDKKLAWFKKILAGLWIIVIIAAFLAAMYILFLLNNFIFLPAAILGMVIVLMFVLSKIVPLRSAYSIIPILTFLGLIIFLIGGNFNLVTPDFPTEVSLSRGLSWNIAKQSIKHDPLIGSGPATFDYAFVKYRGTGFNANSLWNLRFDSASGSIFELLATVGILGTFALLAVGLILVSITFIALSRSENKQTKLFLLGAFASLTIMAVNVCVATVSGSIILLIAALGTLTAALIISDYPEKFKELKISFRSSPKYALALAALFLLVSAGVVILFTSGFKLYLADFYARQALSAGSQDGAVKYMNRAIATADYQYDYYTRLSQLYIALVNQEAQKGNNASLTNIQNYLSLAITAGKKAVDLSPNNVANIESLALIYENAAAYNIGGALEWAEKYYTEMTQLEPDSPSAYIRLALINIAHANNEKSEEEKKHFYDEAIKFYQQAIAKKSDFAQSYYGLAIVYEKTGDYDKAVEELGKAVTLANDNLDYRFELGRMYFNRGVKNQNLQQQSNSIASADAQTQSDETTNDNKSVSVGQEQSGQTKVSATDDVNTAKAIFENILSVSPKHANAIYSLALIYESLGDKAKAKNYYEKLLDIVPDQATKDQILQKLQSL